MTTLSAQATAVARAAANLRGHVENLQNLVSARRRPEHELTEAQRWLPDLEAAAITMERLATKGDRA